MEAYLSLRMSRRYSERGSRMFEPDVPGVLNTALERLEGVAIDEDGRIIEDGVVVLRSGVDRVEGFVEASMASI